MKILTIPDENNIDYGTYGPACEGFIDSIKNLFINKNAHKEKVEQLHNERYPHASDVAKDLSKTLKDTYNNTEWVNGNLPKESGTIQVKFLKFANVNQKQITHPSEILKIAKGMLTTFNQIVEREKPFIELRNKFIEEIQDETDVPKIEAFWKEHGSKFTTRAVDRYRQSRKPPTPALGELSTKHVKAWPINYLNTKDTEFTYLACETDGSFVKPNQANAREFANVILELTEMATQITMVGQQLQVPEWEILEVDYDSCMAAVNMYKYLASGQGMYEVTDLAYDICDILGKISAGLYIAMFDNHSAK